MLQPAFQRKLERMVDGQKRILVQAAFGESPIWDNLAGIYGFAPEDLQPLRIYIYRTYDAGGDPLTDHPLGPSSLREQAGSQRATPLAQAGHGDR